MNVTVDDFERFQVTYFPADKWQHTAGSDTLDRYLGSTTYTSTQNAYAVFNFSSATAIYFMGYGAVPQNPSGIEIQLDSQIFVIPDNINPSGSRAEQILFSKTGLDPSMPHSIIVRKVSADDQELEIDAFIYTLGSAQGGDSPSGSGLSPGALAGIVVGGVLVGGLMVLASIWLIRRRRASRLKNTTPEIDPYPAPLAMEIKRQPSAHKSPLPAISASSSTPFLLQRPSPSSSTPGSSLTVIPFQPSNTSFTSLSPTSALHAHPGGSNRPGNGPTTTNTRQRAGSEGQILPPPQASISSVSSHQPQTARRNVRFASGVPSEWTLPPYPGSPT